MKKQNIGTMFDSWLREEGVYEQVSANAIKRILARQDDKIFGFLEGKRRIVGDVENTIPASDWKALTTITNEEAMAHASRVFGSEEKADAWLRRPNPRHERRRTIELMDTPEGRAKVEGMLIQIDDGMFT
jgi:hypothetical protein